MGAGLFIGRAGGIAVALGIGVAVANGTAIATADRDSGSSAEGHSRSASESRRAEPGLVAAAKPASSMRSQAVSGGVDRSARSAPPASASASASASGASAAAASATDKRPAAAAAFVPATTPAAPAATTPAAPAPAAGLAPDPKATHATVYGDLGKWMVNKNGEVADWVGIPYCQDSVCKTMQEPINTVFTVEATNKFRAEAILNRTLRRAGFGPSCCSSVGYQAIVDSVNSQQMPRGGILGIGVLGPGFIERGLLGLIAGIGPAYRDASFLVANSHLRTFGGVSNGASTYIFTGSVSKEFLDTSSGKPNHGYESFDQARDTLLAAMVGVGAKNGGLIDMDNEIPALDPTYTTGDHDGLAQVIQLSAIKLGAGGAGRALNPS